MTSTGGDAARRISASVPRMLVIDADPMAPLTNLAAHILRMELPSRRPQSVRHRCDRQSILTVMMIVRHRLVGTGAGEWSPVPSKIGAGRALVSTDQRLDKAPLRGIQSVRAVPNPDGFPNDDRWLRKIVVPRSPAIHRCCVGRRFTLLKACPESAA